MAKETAETVDEEIDVIDEVEEVDEVVEVADDETGADTEEANDGEFADAEADSEEKAPPQKEDKKEHDRKFAEARLWQKKTEQEKADILEKAKKEAYEKALIDVTKGVNPYTGEPIKDSHDVKEYMDMLEIEKAGGDPVGEYAKYQKSKARELAEKEAEKAKAEKNAEWFDNDRKAFSEANPDVDAAKLLKDARFQRFANGKVGNIPMTKIYEDYIAFVGEFEKTAETKAQRIVAKSKASPGSLSGGDPQTISYENMSDADFEKEVQKAKRGELKKY